MVHLPVLSLGRVRKKTKISQLFVWLCFRTLRVPQNITFFSLRECKRALSRVKTVEGFLGIKEKTNPGVGLFASSSNPGVSF